MSEYHQQCCSGNIQLHWYGKIAMYLKMSDLDFIPGCTKKSTFCCPNPQLLMPSPCPHLHLHSTHSPSFFSKHPYDLSFSWSFMIREIFLCLSEMWYSQLFSQVWQLWLTPFLITSVRDKKSMYRGRCRLAPRQTNEAMFFCFFIEMSVVLSLQSREHTKHHQPSQKMIYIF